MKAVRAHFPDKLADYTRATTDVAVPEESSALNFLRSRIEKVEEQVEKLEAHFKAFGEDHFEELLVRFRRARSEERYKIINENRKEIESFTMTFWC
ncbi:MAG: hypothetical protein KDK65_05465 [Chlamydiia bacterium]|nr:hypothetical protein [Chlamydiia bacterium]